MPDLDDSKQKVSKTVATTGTLLDTFKAVAWSFFGVRKNADRESDMARLNPVHVVLVGVFLCAVFVLTLIAVVKYVVS